jgi:hypothetical protein
MIVEPKREILLVPLLRVGLRRAWAGRDDFIRLAIVPLIVLLLIAAPQNEALMAMFARLKAPETASPDSGAMLMQGFLLGLLEGATIAVFAVNWIRQLTLGRVAAPGLGVAITGRHVRFFMIMLAVAAGIFLPVIMASAIALIAIPNPGLLLLIAVVLVMLLWITLIARLSPAWIGIAIDAPMPLQIAWSRTAGQGFKLVVALLAVQVVTTIAQEFLAEVLAVVGFIAIAPYSSLLFASVIGLASFAVQISILVTAFPYFLRETV